MKIVRQDDRARADLWSVDRADLPTSGATASATLNDFSDFSNTDPDLPVFWKKPSIGPNDEINLSYLTTEGDGGELHIKRIAVTALAAAIVLFATRPRLFCDTVLCFLLFAPYPDSVRYSRWCILKPLTLCDTTQAKLESALMLCILTTMSFINWSYAWEVIRRSFGYGCAWQLL